MIPIYRISAPNFFNFKIIFALSVLDNFVASKVSTRFSFSLFFVKCRIKTLLNESKMFQFLSLLLVICGCGIPMVLNGFIPIFLSAFRLKSTLILLALFQLLKGKSQSPCTRLSMEALAWLDLNMSLLTNCTLSIASYFNPIVVSENDRFPA